MKTSFVLALLTGFNLLLGFAFQWFLLVTLGPGLATDALFAGMAIPQVVLAVLSASLMHVLVPLMASAEEDEFRRTTWGFYLLLGAGFSLIALALGVSATAWVPWIFPGFSSEGQQLTIDLVRIQLIGMFFTALVSVSRAALIARKRFIYGEALPLLLSSLALVGLVATLPAHGVVVAAWIGAAKAALEALVFLPAMGRFCWPRWNTSQTKLALKRWKPLLMGNMYYKTGPLVDRYFSSLAPPGGLSLLNLGQMIHGAVLEVLNRSIVTPVVPMLSVYAKEKDWKRFHHVYRKRLLFLTALTVGGFLLFVVAGRQLSSLLIGYGSVTQENVDLLWMILMVLSGFMVFGSQGQVLSSSFYASGDTRLPTQVGVAGFTIGVAAKIIGFYQLGLLGIALGASLHQAFNTSILFVALERKLAARKKAQANEGPDGKATVLVP